MKDINRSSNGFSIIVRRWRNAVTFATACFVSSVALPALSEGTDGANVQEWDFRVLLDDKEIGYHRFRLEEDGRHRYIESDAEFDVKFLFFTAYEYRHSNRERWQGDCLASIDTKTNTNGETVTVTGEQSDAAFVVKTESRTDELPECVMTFAYWDRDFLEQSRLLNVQTGELVDVSVEKKDTETLSVRGQDREAQRYRLTSEGVQIDVWYTPDGQWIALESPAKGGRMLRYELA